MPPRKPAPASCSNGSDWASGSITVRHASPEANASASPSARALINQPKLLLADEPTGNLDQATAESVGSLLLEIAAEQQTMLICVTHSLELAGRFPRRYELVGGRLEPR